MTATIDREFAEHLLQTFDDPDRHGVHLLFNQFWAHAPAEVVATYAARFDTDEALHAFVAEHHFAEPLSLDRLASCAPDTLGRALHRFLVENGLEKNLATNYRRFHEALRSAGVLAGMPDPMQYAVLRGFQIHDFLHVVTGYGPKPRDEIALQAFCLAQLPFPYFSMWMSVVTTRMTFIAPDTIVPVMDAVSEGWQYGRRVADLQFERWEDHLDEPLAQLRPRYGIAPEGRGALGERSEGAPV